MGSQAGRLRAGFDAIGATLAIAVATMLSPDARAAGCTLGVMADLPVTMEGLRASVPVKINGRDTRLWLDSGAFFSIMPKARALDLGLRTNPLPMWFTINGIGGNSSAELATVKEFGIVGQKLRNIDFIVGGSDAGNGLIGRNLIALADTEFNLANGSIKLVNAKNCDKSAMAYWAVGKPYFTVPLVGGSNPHDHRLDLPVTINGAKITASIDSGAPTSLLSRRAVQRAGIDLSGSGVVPIGGISGFGRHAERGWIVPVADVGVGDEHILKARITVIDGPIVDSSEAPDMLIGADFLMAHHLYISRGQRTIYFTYSGGKPFITEHSMRAAEAPNNVAAPALPAGTRLVEAVADATTEPRTADEFARRGSARLTAREYGLAVSDFSAAIRLSPGTAGYYRQRAQAHGESGQPLLARADFDSAIKLDPANPELLRMRALMRMHEKDRAGAQADIDAAISATPAASIDAVGNAEILSRLGDPARAIGLLNPVIQAHREDVRLPMLLNARCWARSLAGTELAAAIDDCNRAIKRAGPNAQMLDSRGLANLRAGNLAAALADYDAALALAPKQAWSLYGRSLIHRRQGDANSAAADLAAAQAVEPDILERAAGYGIKD